MSDAVDILVAKVRDLESQLQAAADAAHQRAQERVTMQAEVNDWIRAAMRATMPHEFGIAFDPTSPMAWAESRRHALDMLLTERDALKAQLATARADVVREALAMIDAVSDNDGAVLAYKYSEALHALLDGGTA